MRSLILSSHSRYSNEFSFGNASLSHESTIIADIVGPRYTQPIIRDPLFQIPFWNVRNRVKDDLPRSQASMEATHLAFQVRINKLFASNIHIFFIILTCKCREQISQIIISKLITIFGG